jgi:hypothetical protein
MNSAHSSARSAVNSASNRATSASARPTAVSTVHLAVATLGQFNGAGDPVGEDRRVGHLAWR